MIPFTQYKQHIGAFLNIYPAVGKRAKGVGGGDKRGLLNIKTEQNLSMP